MENFRDRLSGRDRGGRDRYDRGMDRADRYDRDDIDERNSRRAPGYSGDVQIDDIAKAMEQSNSKQLEVISDCLEDVKDEVYASEKELLKAIDRVADSVDSSRGQHISAAPQQPAVDPAMKEELLAAIFSNTNLLNSIREMMLKKEEEAENAVAAAEKEPAQAPEENETMTEEQILKTVLAGFYNDMEEHVHKENVKCYRNVQAALQEQSEQIVNSKSGASTFVKIFLILNLAFSVANIALFVCYLLNLI